MKDCLALLTDGAKMIIGGNVVIGLESAERGDPRKANYRGSKGILEWIGVS
jgi:hypothetical protein